MEVMGVLSSWETLATNSCLDLSRAFMRPSTLLKASAICMVSIYWGALMGSLE